MTEADLARVEAWLHEPQVARWWTVTTVETEVEKYRRRVTAPGRAATAMLLITEDDRPIGWCQWYRWDRYPEEAVAMGARPGEVGIDYAIGEPTALHRGVGTAMIAALVAWVQHCEPGAGVLVDPDAANLASRGVLERNGFELVAVRPVTSEATDDPMAIYRLAGSPVKAPAGSDPASVPVLLVDAANVVGSRPTGWWRDRPGATRRLIDHLRAAIAGGRLDPSVVVVLEGAGRKGAPEGEIDGVRVVHAERSADDRLVELARTAAAPVVVVTADRELRRRVVELGATAVGPDWLYTRLGGEDRSL